jgi:hypothetical protein
MIFGTADRETMSALLDIDHIETEVRAFAAKLFSLESRTPFVKYQIIPSLSRS